MGNETVNINNVIINSAVIETIESEISLSKINIFVGSNNSGKSRIIRTIIDKLKVEYEYKYTILENHLSEILSIYKRYADSAKDIPNRDKYTTFIKDIESLEQIKGFGFNSRHINTINASKVNLENMLNQSQHSITRTDRININNKIKEIENFIDEKTKEKLERTFYYIPTLRGLRSLDFIDGAKWKIEESFVKAQLERDISFNKDFYKGKTLKDYWANGRDIVSGKDYNFDAFEKTIGINVFTGLDLYNELTEMMLGSDIERKSIQEWCKYLEEYYFEEIIEITPNIKEKVVKLKLGNQVERSIHDLGDGLQSIIIITFVMFKCKNINSLIAIEEPELFLHPGMQRILVQNMLNEEFSKLQFLITTHSNHFLEILYENKDKVLIYNCERTDNQIIINNLLNTKEGEVLTNLGVKASSVFLSNGIIMVEGLSDIIYFRKFLNLYMETEGMKMFVEDKHYTFIESAGNNIVHWDFLDGEIKSENIFKNVFLIVDGDGIDIEKIMNKKQSKKESRLMQINNLKYSYVLRSRETENLLPWNSIKKYIIEKESNYGGKYRKIDENKIPNIRETTYKRNYLGSFIQKKLEELKKSLKNQKIFKYHSDSGTICNKLEFARGVCKHIENFEQLTFEAKEITKQVYNFIVDVNK